jgi:hypothetical protein
MPFRIMLAPNDRIKMYNGAGNVLLDKAFVLRNDAPISLEPYTSKFISKIDETLDITITFNGSMDLLNSPLNSVEFTNQKLKMSTQTFYDNYEDK